MEKLTFLPYRHWQEVLDGGGGGGSDVSSFERITLGVGEGKVKWGQGGWGERGVSYWIDVEPARKQCLLLWIGYGQQIGKFMCKQEAETPGIL